MFISDIYSAKIRNGVGQLFRVHEGEGKTVLVLWLTLTASVIANYLIWSTLETTFIKRIGINAFPNIFLLSSLAILLGSVVYTKLLPRFKKLSIIYAFNFFGIISVAASWIALFYAHGANTLPLTIAYFALGLIGNSAFLAFVSSQIWVVVNDVFTTSQSKRLFPLIGTSGTVSGVIAGLMMQLLTPVIGSEQLLLVAVFFMLLTIPGLMVFQKQTRKILALTAAFAIPGPKKRTQAVKEMFRYVFSSRFIIALAGLVLIHWLLIRFFGFLFAAAVDHQFPTEDAFLRFSGLYLVFYSIGSLLFDSLLLNRILERIGLTKGMFLTSNVVTVISALMFAFPLFVTTILANYVRDVILSVQNNSYQVMIGVIPYEHRQKLNAFMDGWVATLGGSVGSVIVLVAVYLLPAGTTFEAKVRLFALFILILLAIRFAVNFYLRREFFRILEDQLSNADVKTKQNAIETLVEHRYNKREGIGRLIDVLKDASEPLSIKETVLKVLGAITDPSTMRVLIHQLRSPEPALRQAAARALGSFHLTKEQFYDVAFSGHHAIEELRWLFEHEADSVTRAAALDALIHLEDKDIVPFLLELLKRGSKETRADCLHSLRLFHDPAIIDDVRPALADKDPLVRNHALVALWQFPWQRDDLRPVLQKMLDSKNESEYRLGIKTVGDIHLTELIPFLRRGLSSKNPPVIRVECALSLFKMGIPDGKAVVEEILNDSNPEAIERIEIIAAMRVTDRKADAILQELIEQSLLEMPADLPSAEKLHAPLGMIPESCLKRLQEIYHARNVPEEMKKIHHFLANKKVRSEAPKANVLLIEPNPALYATYEIALLANGYMVNRATKAPSKLPTAKTIVIADAGGNTVPELSSFSEDVQSRIIRIAGRARAAKISAVAELEKQSGVVFRDHYAPSELIRATNVLYTTGSAG